MPRLTPENKELHTAFMRKRLCTAFAEMFAADGDVSMEHLAEKLGIAKGTIYNYFRDKDELISAVMEIRRSNMVELMEQNISPESSGEEQLGMYIRIMIDDFNRYRYLRMEYLRRNPLMQLSSHSRPRPVDILKQIVERSIRSGEFRKNDPEEASLFIFCSIIGKFRHLLLNNRDADPESEYRTMMKFLIPALKGTKSPEIN